MPGDAAPTRYGRIAVHVQHHHAVLAERRDRRARGRVQGDQVGPHGEQDPAVLAVGALPVHQPPACGHRPVRSTGAPSAACRWPRPGRTPCCSGPARTACRPRRSGLPAAREARAVRRPRAACPRCGSVQATARRLDVAPVDLVQGRILEGLGAAVVDGPGPVASLVAGRGHARLSDRQAEYHDENHEPRRGAVWGGWAGSARDLERGGAGGHSRVARHTRDIPIPANQRCKFRAPATTASPGLKRWLERGSGANTPRSGGHSRRLRARRVTQNKMRQEFCGTVFDRLGHCPVASIVLPNARGPFPQQEDQAMLRALRKFCLVGAPMLAVACTGADRRPRRRSAGPAPRSPRPDPRRQPRSPAPSRQPR